MVANISPRGFKIQPFSEHGHVAYQIKGNHKCSYMVANILPAYPSHQDPGVQKVNIQLVQKMVM